MAGTTGYIELHGMSRSAADKFVATKKALDRERTRAEEAEEKALSSVTAFAAGLGIGFAESYYDNLKEPFGIPLPILVGVGAHLADLAMPHWQYSDRLNNIGDAGLAVYGADMGRQFADTKKQKDQQTSNA